MGLSCRIVRDNKGQLVKVLNNQDKPSLLFYKALEITKNPEKALDLWAVHDTPEYKQKFGPVKNIDSLDINSLVSIFTDVIANGKGLSPSETFEVKNIMRRLGIPTLSGLHSELESIFFSGNKIQFNPKKAIESGIFSPEDVATLDVAKAVEVVLKIEATLKQNDFFVDSSKEQLYFKPSVKTILGSSTLAPEQELLDEWVESIDNLQDNTEVEAKLESLPYKDFVNKVKQNLKLFVDRITNLKRIPTLSFVGDSLEIGTSTYATIKNTIKNNIPYKNIQNEVTYISNILPTVWSEKREAVTGLLKEIEEEVAEYGIDIVGLSKLNVDRDSILNFLNSLKILAENPTDNNILAFSQEYDKLFGVKPSKEVINVDPRMKGYNLVRIYTQKTDKDLFENYGLIKVGNNLYHKVKNSESIGDLYEALYNVVNNGKVNIKLTKESKEKDLRVLEQYINSRNTGMNFKNERLSLYQVLFNHPELKNNTEEELEFLPGIASDEKYLKTNFVADLYDYVLSEKLKDSPLYNGLLNRIKFNDNDIEIDGSVSDFANTEYYQKLTDYLRLRKNSDSKSLVDPELKMEVPADIAAVNNPNSVEQYQEYSVKRGNLVAIPETNKTHIRIGNDVYQKVSSTGNTSVFAKMKVNTDPRYYTTKAEIYPYTSEEMSKSLSETFDKTSNEEQKNKDLTKDKPFLKNLVNKAKTLFSSLTQTGEAEKATDQTFQQNLITFIKAKGIPVIVDNKMMQSKLESLGFSSINAMIDFFSFKETSTKYYVNILRNGLSAEVVTSPRSKINTPFLAQEVARTIQTKIEQKIKDMFPDVPYNSGMYVSREASTLTLNKEAIDNSIDLQAKEDKFKLEQKEFYDMVDAELKAIATEEANQEFEQDMSAKRDFEINRGVTEEWLRDELNFLKTTKGNILGFEHKGTIYLDENSLNTVTTLHELTHVFQSTIDQRAAKGDTKAQAIINKRQELFQEEANLWKEFHKGKKTELKGKQMIVGELASQRVPQLGDMLNKAKQLEEQGLSRDEIYNQTNWYKIKGDWKFFAPELLKQLTPTNIVVGKEMTLNEVLDPNATIFTIYPELKNQKIEFYEQTGKNTGIEGNFDGDKIKLATTIGEDGSRNERWLGAVLAHEIQHKIQRLERQAEGGSVPKLLGFVNNILGFPVNYKIKSIEDLDITGKNLNEEDRRLVNELTNIAKISFEKQPEAFNKAYQKILGEVDANITELAYKIIEGGNQVPDYKILLNFVLENVGTNEEGTLVLKQSNLKNINFQIIGEQGAKNIDKIEEATYRLDNLETAKRMESAGKDEKTIRLATGWEKGIDGKWRYEIDYGNVDLSALQTKSKNTTLEVLGNTPVIELNLEDIFKNDNLYKAYPQFKNKKVYIYKNINNDQTLNYEAFTYENSIFINQKSLASAKDIFIHEIQHEVQKVEGFARGTSELYTRQILMELYSDFGIKNTPTDEQRRDREVIKKFVEKYFTREQINKILQTKKADDLAYRVYQNSSGEVEAYNAEDRSKLTLKQRYEILLSDTEKVNREDQIIMLQADNEKLNTKLSILGIDLSSEVYAQRADETNQEYNERLLKEIEAYVVSPQIADKLEKLKQEDPSLWQKIIDFIKSITDYLKSQIGLQDYQGDIMSMTKQEYIDALGISILKDDYSTEAEKYFQRNADRLPLTLQVFERPEFKAMQGKMVNPITVLNSLNQSGIKQIEKDLIKSVIEENYQGQKKVSYDELEATVRANIMPLERIFTSSYADYGMNNLGNGDYGNANTIILNAPIEHGVTGHFPAAFKAQGRKNIKYVAKQLNDNTWVAVEENYQEQGANNNNIYQFVGTAGTKESVESWIENYENEKKFANSNYIVYEDIFYKTKDYNNNVNPIDGFKTKEEAESFIKQNNDKYDGNLDYLPQSDYSTTLKGGSINKGMFAHIRVWQSRERDFNLREESIKFDNEMYQKYGGMWQDKLNSEEKAKALDFIKRKRQENIVFYVAEAQSDYFQKNKAKEQLLSENKDYNAEVEKIGTNLYQEVISNYELEYNSFVDHTDSLNPRIEEYWEAIEKNTNLSLFNAKYEEKEKVEKWIEENQGQLLRVPYSLLTYKPKELTDKYNKEIEKLNNEFIKNLPAQEKQFIASQKEWEKRLLREALKEAALSGAITFRLPTPYTLSVIEGYISIEDGRMPYQVARESFGSDDGFLEVGSVITMEGTSYTVVRSSTASMFVVPTQYLITNVKETLPEGAEEAVEILPSGEEKLFYYYESEGETLNHPNNYSGDMMEGDRVSKDSFSIENSLIPEQQTVARKYEELAKLLEQERGSENVKIITDKNGFDWYETKIDSQEINKPVIAFQTTSALLELKNSFSQVAESSNLDFIAKQSDVKLLQEMTDEEEEQLSREFDSCRH